METVAIILSSIQSRVPGASGSAWAVLAEGGAGGEWNSMIYALILMAAGAMALRMAMRARKQKDDPVLRHPGRVVPLSPIPSGESAAGGGADADGGHRLDLRSNGRQVGSHVQREEVDDARAVVAEVKQLRRVLAEEADRHAERLEGLIAKAEESIRRLETISASDAAQTRSASNQGHGPQVDPLARRIYELADEGLPPVEIARSLNQQTGKVELVLALRPR